MHLAWFSPLPPHRSGIAAYSADVLSRLAARHEVTAFVDDGPAASGIAGAASLPGVTIRGAHDFPPAEAQHRHDVAVFQVGNDVCHHYMWPYLVHYPGLVVLHDGQLHQARARALIREFRADDYAAEFEFAHPEANPDVAQLVIDGLGGSLYYFWPMLRVPVESARLVAVHSPWLASSIRERYPQAQVTHIRMGVPDPLPLVRVPAAEIRRRHGIPDDAVVFAAYGRVTPEKGLTRVLMALGQLGDAAARAHVLCVGETVDYCDLLREAAELGLASRVHVSGYVSDQELPSYLAAADVCLCLRWPTGRETSASWLRCVAAGKPTVITDLLHTGDVPTLDLRTMRTVSTSGGARNAIAIMIELIDDVSMLRLALERLSRDAALRARVGAAARAYWASQATLDVMTRDYETALADARTLPAPVRQGNWPAHLGDGSATGRAIVREIGVPWPL
jgi:glycosyltransferase involved in cell wall biosynthesis